MPNKTALPSRRRILRAASVALGAAATSSFHVTRASAAAYPERPIKIVVPFAPAGPTDIIARILGQNLGAALGGNVIVENRPGAGGNIGIGYVAHAEADGYALLVISSAFVVNPGLYAKSLTTLSRILRRSPNSAPRRMRSWFLPGSASTRSRN
ncbi:MAG TPA: tripartite tricarboxylate transporter substrate-binding protein [Bradyrhizobium sp.]|nr:tripartite tricarboxylate transporter substrate-binding protein [Bradyrhizobium sp.]